MKTIDLRSDTVTLPTLAMRTAMANAEVGDDVYGDDPTVLSLERLAAQKVNKAAAMFVPSGTMGNQLAIMAHTRRGDELITGRNNHIVSHEVGAIGVLSGANVWTLDHPNDWITPEAFINAIRPIDIHVPSTTLLCMENALSNGQVMPLELMKENFHLAKERGIQVHLDGARLFNAATHLGVEASELANCADSVMFCLSKGLAAPIGSILAGEVDFIAKARKYRKMLGGGLRQAGILAAAGIIALEEMVDRLAIDHQNARYLARRLNDLDLADIDLSLVHINMVFATLKDPKYATQAFVDHLLLQNIKVNPASNGQYRFVTHHNVSKEDIDAFLEVINSY